MKKKIILSSVATIVVCLALIAGSTYALFTDNSQVNIAVTSGKIDVTATINQDSLVGVSVIGSNSTDAAKDVNTNVLTFENGGTATWDASTASLVLDRVTPGDFATFKVTGTNASNVAVRYCYVVSLVDDPANAEDTILTTALTVKVNGQTCTLTDGQYFVSDTWELLPADGSGSIPEVEITVGIDESVGNGFTDGSGNFVTYHDRTAKINIVLQAVQGNGEVVNGEPLN